MARLPNFLVIIRSEKLSGKGQGRGVGVRKKERFVLGKRTFRSQKSKHFVLRIITGNGLAKRTLNRGEENNYMMVFPGVTESGEVNTKQVSASEYYGALQAEDFIYDASFIKLKELSIGYSFPSSMLKKTPVNSLNVSFVARNLCYLMKHTPGTSPEGGYDTTMFSQAIDYASLPFTRTFGISINLGF